MQIVPINTSHADELSALAKNIYKEYYLHLWHPGGADWYMNEYAYHPDTIMAEISDNNNLHYIVYDDEKHVGYLKIRINATPEIDKKNNILEIERIYLHKIVAGKGIGNQLMLLSEDIARQHKKGAIFIKAMDSSLQPIAFYKKMGYTECGTLTLPFPQMKQAYRGMVILKKDL